MARAESATLVRTHPAARSLPLGAERFDGSFGVRGLSRALGGSHSGRRYAVAP